MFDSLSLYVLARSLSLSLSRCFRLSICQGLNLAQQYLKAAKRPEWLPISRVLEGGENESFNAYFDSF